MYYCHRCAHLLTLDGPVGRAAECPSCRSALHVCLNCRFYDPAAHHQCREPQVEWVADKEKANFCEFFTFRDLPAPPRPSRRQDAARKALDDLFRKKPE